MDGIHVLHLPLFAALKHRSPELLMTPTGEFLMLKEWGLWERYYLPVGGVKGKVILDAGAGDGETAWFYLSHGARKVVSVEPDPVAFSCLEANAKRYGWPVVCLNEKFNLSHLEGVDIAKIDVEGGEYQLLELDRLLPGCVEVHGREMKEKFAAKWPHLRFKKVSMKNWIARTP